MRACVGFCATQLLALGGETELPFAEFIARHGLDAAGRLFKSDHWKYSNLRPPNMQSECPFTAPDYDCAPACDRVCASAADAHRTPDWPRGKKQCPIIFVEQGEPTGKSVSSILFFCLTYVYVFMPDRPTVTGSAPHIGEVESLAQQISRGDLSHLDMDNVVTEMAGAASAINASESRCRDGERLTMRPPSQCKLRCCTRIAASKITFFSTTLTTSGW